MTNCPLTLSSGNSRYKCNSTVTFSCGCTEVRKTIVHAPEHPTTPLVTAESTLAFDQRSSKLFPAFWIKKVRLKPQNNWPLMHRVDLTLIWALIRPFEQQSKHFDGNGVPVRALSKPTLGGRGGWPHMPPQSHCCGSTREARLAQCGFLVPAPVPWSTVRQPCLARQPMHAPWGKGPCGRQAARWAALRTTWVSDTHTLASQGQTYSL